MAYELLCSRPIGGASASTAYISGQTGIGFRVTSMLLACNRCGYLPSGDAIGINLLPPESHGKRYRGQSALPGFHAKAPSSHTIRLSSQVDYHVTPSRNIIVDSTHLSRQGPEVYQTLCIWLTTWCFSHSAVLRVAPSASSFSSQTTTLSTGLYFSRGRSTCQRQAQWRPKDEVQAG